MRNMLKWFQCLKTEVSCLRFLHYIRTNPKETLNGKLPFCAVFIYNLTQGNQSKLHFLIVDKAVYSYCVLYMIDLKIKSTDTVELL